VNYGSDKPLAKRREPARWQVSLSNFFAKLWVELSIGALVLVSVGLTLLEFALAEISQNPREDAALRTLDLLNDLITGVFVIELSLRYAAATSKRHFFRTFWLDIIAVMPMFRIFRAGRAIRLLRLLRLLRAFGLVSRLASHFPYVLRRGAFEYIVVCGLLVLTVIFASGGILFFEGRQAVGDLGQDDEHFGLEDSFWFSVYSLFAGEPIPDPPRTLGGKVITVFVMFMGLTIFAMFTGTVSAFMVERLQSEGGKVDWDAFQDHVILCGWNNQAEIIIRELRASPGRERTPIVVITSETRDQLLLPPDLDANVSFYFDDFTRITVLEKVGIHRAAICIILADTRGGRSDQDADARTILAALTVEKLNPDVYTCAELMNRSYGSHLQMGRVNDYVISGEHGAFLLAQAAMNRGLMDVFSELLTYQRGNEFYRIRLPDTFAGQSFLELLVDLKKQHNALLVSVHTADGQMFVNPNEYVFRAGDEIVVIAEEEFSLEGTP
jgi:voltage-gated potassium channel